MGTERNGDATPLQLSAEALRAARARHRRKKSVESRLVGDALATAAGIGARGGAGPYPSRLMGGQVHNPMAGVKPVDTPLRAPGGSVGATPSSATPWHRRAGSSGAPDTTIRKLDFTSSISPSLSLGSSPATGEQTPSQPEPRRVRMKAYRFTDDDFGADCNITAMLDKLAAPCLRAEDDGGATSAAPGGVPAALSSIDTTELLERFKDAQEDLGAIEDRLTAELEELADGCAAREDAYGRMTEQVGPYLDTVFEHFEHLETRISHVGSTAVRLGERLDTVNAQRQRALDAAELLRYFCAFARRAGMDESFSSNQGASGDDAATHGNTEETDKQMALFTDPARADEAARLLTRLQALATDVSDGDGSRSEDRGAVEEIRRECERFEQRLVERFQAASQDGDEDAMHRTAEILEAFNGNANVARMYVMSLPMFQDEAVLTESERLGLGPENVYGVGAMVEDVIRTCGCEVERIRRIFPTAGPVIRVLIERVFEQRVQGYIGTILRRARDVSEQTFLTTLRRAYETAHRLLSREEGSLAMLCGDDADVARHVESVFHTWKEEYVSAEMSQLKRDLESTGTESEGGFVDELAVGEVNMGAAMEMIGLLAEALERARAVLAVTHENVLPSLAESATRLLALYALGVARDALDAASTAIPSTDVRSARNATVVASAVSAHNTQPAYTAARDTNAVVQLVEEAFAAHVLPCTSADAAEGVRCRQILRDATMSLEASVSSVLRRALTSTLALVEAVLRAEQRRADYRPREDAPSAPGAGCTPGCSSACSLVRREASRARSALDGRNVDGYLFALGAGLVDAVLAALRRCTISQLGAVVVLADVSEYQALLSEFRVDDLEPYTELLRGAANLFLVPLDHVRSVIQESPLHDLESAALQRLLECREDLTKKHAKERIAEFLA